MNYCEYEEIKDVEPVSSSEVDEHARLAAEIPVIQRLPISERLLLARRRRLEQVTRYEWWLRRDGAAAAGRHASHTADAGQRAGPCVRRSLRFAGTVSLLEAVRANDINEVRALLQRGPRGLVNASVSDGLTALHQACIIGSLEIVDVLLTEFSASVNCRDDDLWTPLHTVALCGYSHIARCLIDRGADVLAMNSDGNMPYDLCEDEITLDVIESAMAKQGVTQELINELRAADEQKMLRDLRRLARRGHDLQFTGQHGETPLHVAACNGYVAVGQYLLSQSVDVDAPDQDCWTPLHHAALWRQVSMMELLVGHGADITAVAFDGRSPCDVCGDAAVRDWLLKLKATQSMTSPSVVDHPVVESKTTAEASQTTSMYSSNLSVADKSTLISSSRRLESAAAAASERDHSSTRSAVRRKDASDETQLWSSMQSLADDEDLIDSLSRSAAAAPPSARLVPPAQFRRPTPPSIDDQLQVIADKLGLLNSDARQPTTSTTPRQQATASSNNTGSNSGAASCEPSRRSSASDERRRRSRDDKTKPAGKNGQRAASIDAGTTKVTGANWQLKSPTDSGRSKHTARPTVNGGGKHNHSTDSKTIPADVQLNGQAGGNARRGQTSAELKKRRSTQRQNGLTLNHDDWPSPLTSPSVIDKKSTDSVGTTAANTMLSSNGCCVVM